MRNLLIYQTGQSCNVFFQYLFFLRKAILEKQLFIVLIPDTTIEDYPHLLHSKFIRFPFYYKIIVSLVGKNRNRELMKNVTAKFLNYCCRNNAVHRLNCLGINLVSGPDYWLRDEDYSSVLPSLQHLFELKWELKRKVDLLWKIEKNYLVIGVHIRRGDYKTWRNGRYYFSDATYLDYMLKVQALLGDERKVVFFICSNEHFLLDNFGGVACFTIPDNSATQDLYALSKCDYLIGPLSSFTSWVSLLYQIPYYSIVAKDDYKDMQLSFFSPTKNYQYKQNGYVFERGIGYDYASDSYYYNKVIDFLGQSNNACQQ